jgi:hypothetical protein
MISRWFLPFTVTLAAGIAMIGTPSCLADDAGQPQYYELRVYTTASAAQQQRVMIKVMLKRTSAAQL